MENVEVKKDAGVEVKETAKPKMVDAAKKEKDVVKPAKRESKESREAKVAFMEKRNEARANSKLPPAYSKEQIEAYKK